MGPIVHPRRLICLLSALLAWLGVANADEMDCYGAGSDEAMRMLEGGQIDAGTFVQLATGVAHFCGSAATAIHAAAFGATTGVAPSIIVANAPAYYNATKKKFRRVYALARAAKGDEVTNGQTDDGVEVDTPPAAVPSEER
ncbi:MAG: hypothetical protein WD673_13425 [Alphaproteobacteria bacterium]